MKTWYLRAPRNPRGARNLVTDKGQRSSLSLGHEEEGLKSNPDQYQLEDAAELLSIGDACWALKHYQDRVTFASPTRNMGH